MRSFDCSKYRPASPVPKSDRRWPDHPIVAAPRWASVDLRDGNQALLPPMDFSKKSRLFDLLVSIGIREIEVGFPSAAESEFAFVRGLIEAERVPEEVTIQVLTPARAPHILRSFEAMKGARKASMHLYNPISPAQRALVFRTDRVGVREIAVQGARLIREQALRFPETLWSFQYTPESFSATEPDFAVEVCAAVAEIWQDGPAREIVMNLPATMERSTPNLYADQVEWFLDHFPGRERIVVSVHPHNDRGTAIAAGELAVMAGADRVEGTLFGIGERTGNLDLLVMAMNLYSQGVDPGLDLSRSSDIVSRMAECTGHPLSPRHPWFGERVYTAASGGHQDAIRKGLAHYRAQGGSWTVPYLPIDPQDIGRSYEEVVRLGSLSGKGGIGYVLEGLHGLDLPDWLLNDFTPAVKKTSEKRQEILGPDALLSLFEETYVKESGTFRLRSMATGPAGRLSSEAVIGGESVAVEAQDSCAVQTLITLLRQRLKREIALEETCVLSRHHRPAEGVLGLVRLVLSGPERTESVSLCGGGFGMNETAALMRAILQALGRGL